MPDTATGGAASEIFRSWDEIRLDQALLLVAAAALLIAAVRWFVPKLASWVPERFRFRILPWEPILRVAILALLGLKLLPIFIQPTTENLLAIAGASAVALGFAFKDYAASLVAGVVALYERPYRAGDWVEIGGVYGEVQSLGLRTARLKTPDDTEVSVPHGLIWTQPVHNANSGARDLMCVADFYLDPDHDGEQARRLLTDVALTSPYLNLERPVTVVAAEKPWGTHYRLKAYPFECRDQFQFTTDLTLRAKALLRQGGFTAVTAPVATGGV